MASMLQVDSASLDSFFAELYGYWHGGGFYPNILRRLLASFTVLFAAVALPFAVSCVDYSRLVDCNDTAAGSCGSLSSYISLDRFKPPSGIHFLSLAFLLAGLSYGLYLLAAVFLMDVRRLQRIRAFAAYHLRVPNDRFMQKLSWGEVISLLNDAILSNRRKPSDGNALGGNYNYQQAGSAANTEHSSPGTITGGPYDEVIAALRQRFNLRFLHEQTKQTSARRQRRKRKEDPGDSAGDGVERRSMNGSKEEVRQPSGDRGTREKRRGRRSKGKSVVSVAIAPPDAARQSNGAEDEDAKVQALAAGIFTFSPSPTAQQLPPPRHAEHAQAAPASFSSPSPHNGTPAAAAVVSPLATSASPQLGALPLPQGQGPVAAARPSSRLSSGGASGGRRPSSSFSASADLPFAHAHVGTPHTPFLMSAAAGPSSTHSPRLTALSMLSPPAMNAQARRPSSSLSTSSGTANTAPANQAQVVAPPSFSLGTETAASSPGITDGTRPPSSSLQRTATITPRFGPQPWPVSGLNAAADEQARTPVQAAPPPLNLLVPSGDASNSSSAATSAVTMERPTSALGLSFGLTLSAGGTGGQMDLGRRNSSSFSAGHHNELPFAQPSGRSPLLLPQSRPPLPPPSGLTPAQQPRTGLTPQLGPQAPHSSHSQGIASVRATSEEDFDLGDPAIAVPRGNSNANPAAGNAMASSTSSLATTVSAGTTTSFSAGGGSIASPSSAAGSSPQYHQQHQQAQAQAQAQQQAGPHRLSVGSEDSVRSPSLAPASGAALAAATSAATTGTGSALPFANSLALATGRRRSRGLSADLPFANTASPGSTTSGGGGVSSPFALAASSTAAGGSPLPTAGNAPSIVSLALALPPPQAGAAVSSPLSPPSATAASHHHHHHHAASHSSATAGSNTGSGALTIRATPPASPSLQALAMRNSLHRKSSSGALSSLSLLVSGPAGAIMTPTTLTPAAVSSGADRTDHATGSPAAAALTSGTAPSVESNGTPPVAVALDRSPPRRTSSGGSPIVASALALGAPATGRTSATLINRRRSSSGAAALDLPFANIHNVQPALSSRHQHFPSSSSSSSSGSASAAGSPVPGGMALGNSPSSAAPSAPGSPAAAFGGLMSLGPPPPPLLLNATGAHLSAIASGRSPSAGAIATARPLLVTTATNASPSASSTSFSASLGGQHVSHMLIIPQVKAALSPIRERPIGAPGSALPSVRKGARDGGDEGDDRDDAGFGPNTSSSRLFDAPTDEDGPTTTSERTETSSAASQDRESGGNNMSTGNKGAVAVAGLSAPTSRSSPKAFKPVSSFASFGTGTGVRLASAGENGNVTPRAAHHAPGSRVTAPSLTAFRPGSRSHEPGGTPSSSSRSDTLSASSPSASSSSPSTSTADDTDQRKSPDRRFSNGKNIHSERTEEEESGHDDDDDEDGGISLLDAPAVTAYEAAARIMRRDNFVTALVSNGALGSTGSRQLGSHNPSIVIPLPTKAAFTSFCGFCRLRRGNTGNDTPAQRNGYTAISSTSDAVDASSDTVAVAVAARGAGGSEKTPLIGPTSSASMPAGAQHRRLGSAVVVPPGPPPQQSLSSMPAAPPRTALGLLNNDRSELLRRQRTASSASIDSNYGGAGLSIPLMERRGSSGYTMSSGTVATASASAGGHNLFVSPSASSSSDAAVGTGYYNAAAASFPQPVTSSASDYSNGNSALLTTSAASTNGTGARGSLVHTTPSAGIAATADSFQRSEPLFSPLTLAIPPALFYSSLFEWSVRALVLSDLWSPEGRLYRSRLAVGSSANAFYLRTVKSRLRIAGLIGILISPVLFLLSLLHFAVWTLGDVKASGDYLGPRKWTLHALRLYREYNELPHALQRRLAPSFSLVTRFLSLSAERQSPLFTLAAKVLLLVSGAALAFVLLLGLIDESILLHTTLVNRNLLWWAAILGAVVGISRKLAGSADEADGDGEALDKGGHADSTYTGTTGSGAYSLSRSVVFGKTGAGIAPHAPPGIKGRAGADTRKADEAPSLPLTAAEETLRLLALHTHYLPQEWDGAPTSAVTPAGPKPGAADDLVSSAHERWAVVQNARKSLQGLFQYRLVIFAAEMLAAFITPLLLLFYLPSRVESLLRFVLVHSTHEKLPSLSAASPRKRSTRSKSDVRNRQAAVPENGDGDGSSVASGSTANTGGSGGRIDTRRGGIDSLGDICCYASLSASTMKKERRRHASEGPGALVKWQRSAWAFATENEGVVVASAFNHDLDTPAELLKNSILGEFAQQRDKTTERDPRGHDAIDNDDYERDDRYRFGVGNPSVKERRHWQRVATEGLRVAVSNR